MEQQALHNRDSFAALRFRDFRLYASMRFFFTCAYQMQTTILGFYIYQITHSKVAIAMIGLFEAVPAVGIALYGGYVADKYEKRKMLLFVYGGFLFSSMVLFLITLPVANSWFHLSKIIPVMYAMIFCNGTARAFYAPAAFSVYASSVPREHYANASTWSSSSWQTASILGPMIGGFLYAYGERLLPGVPGISFTFAAILCFILISLFLVYRLKKIPPVFVPKANMWESLSEGLKFVFTNKMMFYAMSLDLFSVLFGGVVALLPVFALDILQVGAEGLGIMRMVISMGAALTMIGMVRYSPAGRPWRNLLIAVAGFGCSIICFGLSKNFYLSLFFLFTQGAFDSVSVIIRSTLMQLLTPDDMRGRVSAVNSMFIGSSNEIGDFESGMAAKLLGTIPSVLFGGAMTLSIVVFTFFKTKHLLPLSLQDIQVVKHEQAGTQKPGNNVN